MRFSPDTRLRATFRGRISHSFLRLEFCSSRVLSALLGNAKLYRGKIAGPILATLSLLIFGFFAYEIFYVMKQVPASAGAPRVGQKAPEFTLPDQTGKPIALTDLLSSSKSAGAVLIFYRGFW